MTKRMGIAISIVLILALIISAYGCDESPVAGEGGTAPPDSASPEATYTDAYDSYDAFATDTAQPEDTSGMADEASSTPEDTASSAEETAAADATASPSPTATPSSGGTLAVDPVIGKAKVSEYLTLRSKASASAQSLAQIPKDGEFTVLQVETGKKWLKVKYGDQTGYVQAKYVSIGSGDSDRVCTVFCNSVLNVRSGAGTGNDVIGSLASGATLVVTAKATAAGSTWYKVSVGSSVGYVIAKYCRIAED